MRSGSSPSPPPTRRPGDGRFVALVAAVAIATTTVGCGSTAAEPTVPTVDFTPRLVLVADEAGLHWEPGPRADGTVSVDPARVPQGAVIEVVNRADTSRRVVGDDGVTWDTGTLQPGDRTVVALTSPIASDRTIAIRVRGGPDASTSMAVVPRAGADT